MDLSIVIVSWNVKEKLKENLKALYSSQDKLEKEIFVVDNNSQDGSAEMVAKMFPGVKLIKNRDNLGFAKANNQAIKEARGNYILLLNPDMKVFPDTLGAMFEWMEQNLQARVAGCKLLSENGKIVPDVRRFPKLFSQMAIILKLPHICPALINRYLALDFDYGQARAVDSIRGSFFWLRRYDDLAKNLLDERYFVWFEEVDYCQQLRKRGEQVWYTPAAQCLDYVGQGFKQLNSGQTQKYFRNSMLAYFKKWQPRWQYVVLKIVWPLGLGITFIFSPKK